jgi:DNA-binding MarR family transcriptional regulator
MAAGERDQLLAELNQRLAAALEAMDYALALACQIEIDDLRRERKALTPSRKHLHLMRQAASPAAVIMKHSRRSEPEGDVMFIDAYIAMIALTGRVHRQFLEVVKLELDRLGLHDINNVQALMLFNIGDAEMTVGELASRGCYLGSNTSYNLKKMVENRYLSYERSRRDRRVIRLRLTRKGAKLRDRLHTMHRRHVEMLSQTPVTDEALQAATATLGRLERFWARIPNIRTAAA